MVVLMALTKAVPNFQIRFTKARIIITPAVIVMLMRNDSLKFEKEWRVLVPKYVHTNMKSRNGTREVIASTGL